MPHSDVIGFAVVGVKGYSRSHLGGVQWLAEQGRGRLIASMMIDKADHPDIVAEYEANGVRVFDDYQAMLDACQGLVDVVTLPVPIHLHAPMTLSALQAGYHVYVEKPIAASLSHVDEMITARDACGRQCAVGFQQIYSPLFQTLKKHIVAGKLGVVRRISIMALWPRSPSYYARNNWAGKLSCGGQPVYDSPFNNALAHQIMNMLYLASPEPQQAAYPAKTEADLYRAYDIESFDTGCMRVQTDNGVEIVFVATHACDVNINPIMKLEAERAHVDWQIRENATITYQDGTIELVQEGEPRKHIVENIADAITGVVPQPMCTLEIARTHVACIRAVHRAAPIQEIANRFVSETEGGQRVISGIQDAVQRAFDTGKLFSELDVPFTQTN